MALGAAPSEMLRMVLRQGFSMAATGIVIGIIAAAGLTRFLGSLLYGVEPLDGPTFALVAVVMMAAALLASYLPARQAAKLNPTAALHCD
jgi:ABC-type antimicrobial peptide transport system permease subunit